MIRVKNDQQVINNSETMWKPQKNMSIPTNMSPNPEWGIAALTYERFGLQISIDSLPLSFIMSTSHRPGVML